MTTRSAIGPITDANGVQAYVETITSQTDGEREFLVLDNGELGAVPFLLTPTLRRDLFHMLNGKEPDRIRLV